MIRGAVDAHDKSIPAILEIPSKEHPYDATKDSILRRARVSLSGKSLFEQPNGLFSFVCSRVCSVQMILNKATFRRETSSLFHFYLFVCGISMLD